MKRKAMPHLWTLPKVKQALPLVDSILATIRENYLAERMATASLKRLGAKPGLRDRHELIEMNNLKEAANRASRACDDAMTELGRLDVVCADPVQCLAAFLFSYQHMPAWYVYSPFGPSLDWRYDEDPLELRRSVKELELPI